MRILFASPYKGNVGGISQWAEHIVNHSSNNNSECELDVLAMNDVKKGRSTIGMSLIQRMIYGLQTYSRVILSERKTLKQKKYDIIHISSSASISLLKDILMIRVARRQRVKTVIHFHFGRIPDLASKRNWEWKLLTHVIKLVDSVVVMDKSSYECLLNLGYSNIVCVPNPLAPSVEDYINSCEPVNRFKNTVTFVGHVVRTKGVTELVTACSSLPDIKVNIIGPCTAEYKTELLSLVDNAMQFNFMGTLTPKEVIREMMACSVFVLPTYTEGFPNVILESMACGCPIISTPVGAIPEMLAVDTDKPCGIVVQSKNVEQLRDAMQRLLNNEEEALQLSKRASERVREEYSIDKVWDLLLDLWKSMK